MDKLNELKQRLFEVQLAYRAELFERVEEKTNLLLERLSNGLLTKNGFVKVPEMTKKEWELVGDLVKEVESLSLSAHGDTVLSFRLDLSNFSGKSKEQGSSRDNL